MDLTVASRQAQTDAETSIQRSLDGFYAEHLGEVPVGDQRAMDFLTLSQANAAAIERAVLPLYGEFQAQLNRQEALVERFQFLSPAIMMQLALNEIAGTSGDRYEDFLRQAYRFKQEWTDYFAVRFLKRDPLRPADYARFPQFRYQPEPFAVVFLRLVPSLLGLLVICCGVILVPFLGIHRYQVAAR
jgi:ABC-2 type transport system permease protein